MTTFPEITTSPATLPSHAYKAWESAYRGQPVLAAAAIFLLLAMVPSLLALMLDDRLLNGINVWIKPMKFQISLAIQMLSVAWLMLLLEPAQRERLWVRSLAWLIASAALFEALYVTWRAAQGIASHYAFETAFGTLMYSLMGVGAVGIVTASAVIGGAILRHGHGPRILVIGAGLGLIMGGVLGGVTGAWMSSQPGHWVGGIASDAGGLALFGWARDGGDLRVAHFFGLHMTQGLPILAFALWFAGISRWKPVLYGATAAGTALTLATFVQASMGRPFF